MVRWAQWCAPREIVLGLALSTSCVFSGVVYGWAALVQMMKQTGVYENACDGDDSCAERDVRLNDIFAIGVFTTFGSRLPLGILLDRIGSKLTVTFSLLLGVLGAFLFARGFYPLGFGLVAAGGPGVHVGAMHVANLFVSRKLTVRGLGQSFH